MIYRIDIQHFYTHAIDYFTLDELTHFQYAIISAAVKNGARAANVVKLNGLYPTSEMVMAYAEYHDKKILEEMYTELLVPKKGDNTQGNMWAFNTIYKSFVNPLMSHNDIVILCDQTENDYIDILCKIIKKYFKIDVIDLNKLFKEGHIGPIYFDRDEVWDIAVDVRRQAGKEEIESLSTTRDGRMKLIKLFNKKEKLNKLKELGIKVDKNDKDLDRLLIEGWVEELDPDE